LQRGGGNGGQRLAVPESTADVISKEGAIRMNCFSVCGTSLAAVGRLTRVAGVVVMVAAVAGCATVTSGSSDDAKRKTVAERAAARWALIIKGDPGAAYDEYMSKGSRAVISRGEFVAKMRVTTFRTAGVEKVECTAQSCKATVEVTYDHKVMKGVENSMVETWIFDDGQAQFVWLQ
jgi:hypothetical protein